jgi:hypothetical protein
MLQAFCYVGFLLPRLPATYLLGNDLMDSHERPTIAARLVVIDKVLEQLPKGSPLGYAAQWQKLLAEKEDLESALSRVPVSSGTGT